MRSCDRAATCGQPLNEQYVAASKTYSTALEQHRSTASVRRGFVSRSLIGVAGPLTHPCHVRLARRTGRVQRLAEVRD